MLKLKNIKKNYKVGSGYFTALHDITLEFKDSEFVAIQGPSGCGKTTLLNIIGGLDQYTEGDLIIEGKSTKDFSDLDWDYYRNNKVGFVFQNYHLIQHISIIDNVEIGMTLSGIPAHERRKKALEVLRRVGLEDQINKKSAQLSGGEKQRVAIARALANNPDIILADEPTGALDSKTSIQILDLIKEISQEKLVIMVTHNEKLAAKYANRTIKMLDGNLISDTKETEVEEPLKTEYKPKKTSMNYLQAIKLSFRNLRTKLGRTLTTAFAGSIGIIGVLLVLALGNGFKRIIYDLETETFAQFPIAVQKDHRDLNMDYHNFEFVDDGYLKPYDIRSFPGLIMHRNLITEQYLAYLTTELDKKDYVSLEYKYETQKIILNKTISNEIENANISKTFNQTEHLFLASYHDLEAGRLPDLTRGDAYEIALVVDRRNSIDEKILIALGFQNLNEVRPIDVVGKQLVVPKYDDYYKKDLTNPEKPIYLVNSSLTNAYENGIIIEVVGVFKPKEDSIFSLSDGLYYFSNLTEAVHQMARDSEILNYQKTVDYLVFSYNNEIVGNSFKYDEPTQSYPKKNDALNVLGQGETPSAIFIYPENYDAKTNIKKVLDNYNKNFEKDDPRRILYLDQAELVGSVLSQVINMIQIVLVVFASISLVVSSIMIGIITYVSVLERTQEIGILRAVGARKKDIKRVFNSETFLIGLTSGVMGSIISFILTFPLNKIIHNLEKTMVNALRMNLIHVLAMIIVSVFLTFIAGLIPSAIAAKKHPVEALRHNE